MKRRCGSVSWANKRSGTLLKASLDPVKIQNTTVYNNIATFLCSPISAPNKCYYCTFSLTLIKHSTNVQESDIYPGCRLFSG